MSDIPSYREVWDGAACFFRANDAVSLRERWRELLASPAQLGAIQSECRERALTRYTPASMLDKYRALYTAAAQEWVAA